ncbi:MAG: sigma-70 family RNA polymerase sigma factor [Caldilineaceae bacterium]
MNFPQTNKLKTPTRTNRQWVDELVGRLGAAKQQQAHADLANYLYIVAYNDLKKQGPDIAMLHNLADQELAAHAQDFVQDVLEKLAQDNFARIHQFRGEGNFTSWAAQIMHRQIIAELRKMCWRRQELLSAEQPIEETYIEQGPSNAYEPEEALLQTDLHEALEVCIAKLPERYRIAFVRRMIDHERAERVAIELKTTANAVNLMLFRARRQLQENLLLLGFSLPG